MPERIILDVVSPEQFVLREEVDELSAPGSEGDFGVLPGHCEFLTTLRAGELHYRIGGKEHVLSLAGGFAEVRADHVIILADSPANEPASEGAK